ncbi:Cro/Cl family transcriptional regulator [Occultella glacieicola]|uniref:Cro/Cl family transcriptional regulator n=1 Tax=Occultella glacieicola TaxID=2518684 RepID=A0ABY2E745_9MICO|nr:sugar-binding domain-containing protein [Occultella glacieicola]TDE97369.1 Cro/Cl family transcriptional regulator [Occultella glacieicola]
MPDVDDPELLREVSVDFYLDGLSKVEIAKERGLSRFQVARMLNSARELGIVRIEISTPAHLDASSGRTLAQALGVREVVISSGTSSNPSRATLARHVARALVDRARPQMTIGVSWSRTIELAAKHIENLPPCEVVQLVGAQPVEGSGNSLEMIQQFKALPGVRTFPIWAPLVVQDAATAAGLRAQPQIARALERAEHLDIAVVAVGGWSTESSTVYSNVSPDDIAEAVAAGAVGECAGHLIDAEGRLVPTALETRIVGVGLDQLRRTPEVIVCAHGASAAPAVRAAVRGGIGSTVVLDPAAAGALTDLLRAESAGTPVD